MNVGERIKRRRKELKMSAELLAEKLGRNRATIYRYEKNEIENMPYDVIEPLAKVLKVTPSYLMGWESDVQLSSTYSYLPVTVAAGLAETIDGLTNAETIDIPDAMMGKWAGNENIFIMKVNGESMNNIIPHGSLIAVKKIEREELHDNDIVIYSDNHEYSMKRFYRNDQQIIFKPDSTDERFFDKVFNENANIQIHGKVVLYLVELD